MATNCIKNGVAYWRSTGSYGRGPDGKLRRKEFLGKNKKEAEQKQKEFESLLQSGLSFEVACIKYSNPHYSTDNAPLNEVRRLLGESIRSWLFDVKRVADNVKASTFFIHSG